jgi:glycosyltransferase involved in cell wall biosynthesis
MLTYCESLSALPPMLNEGVSLASAGFEVEAICLAGAAPHAVTEEHVTGFRTRRLRLRARLLFHALVGRATPHSGLAAVQYLLSYAEYAAKALGLALRSRADVYEANDLPPLLPTVLAAKLRRKPVVYRAHELWPEATAHVRFAWFWRFMERWLVPLCDEVVTPEENRSRIYERELGARHSPLTVRNCPPYRPPIESHQLRDELGRRGVECSTIVLYQGLVDSMRCIEEIAEATRRFDDRIVLVIIGRGHGMWARPAAALAAYERIVVFPRVPYEDLPPYTASADIGILLYRNDCRNNYYCAPNKLFEYMMMGLPVIAANYPGMLPLVEGEGVGVCVDPENPQMIAAAVNKLAADTDARARMKANGLRLSRERYNWAVESEPLLQRYRLLAGAGALAAGGRGAAVGARSVE